MECRKQQPIILKSAHLNWQPKNLFFWLPLFQSRSISGIRLTPTCITYTEDDVFVLPAAEVKNNKENFSDVTDETVLERVKAACDEIIPGLLEGTGLTGQYSENTYVVNF